MPVQTKKYYSALILSALLLADIFIWFTIFRGEESKELKVAFLDVGQGDAIYIEAPNGNQILVDGGSGTQILPALSVVMPFYDKSIDALLATHPDKDHAGGLSFVLDRYKVGKVFLNGARSDTVAYKSLEQKISDYGVDTIIARRGMRINLSKDVHLDILFPDADVSKFKDTNDGSIVAKLIYKNESFLLTGDSSVKIEKYLISLGKESLRANVLKLGHHGSRTSSSEEYLLAVSPLYAIISAGCKNSYGHPHKEVLALLEKLKIPKLSTCDSGTIVFETDGEELSYSHLK